MTIGEIISLLRTSIKEHSDDSDFTDQELYLYLTDAANYTPREALDTNKKITKKNFKSICVPLERVKFGNCDCIPDKFKCDVLKSTFEIPNFLWGSQNVYDVKGNYISYKRFIYLSRIKKHPAFKGITFDIIDNYLYIFGTLTLKTVLLEALWEDITKLAEIPECNDLGEPEGSNCYDIASDEFPLDESYILLAFDTVLKSLNITFKLKDDNTENNRTDS